MSYDNGDMLIADTQNSRIIKCNELGNIVMTIGLPENMTGVSDSNAFFPLSWLLTASAEYTLWRKTSIWVSFSLTVKENSWDISVRREFQPDLFTLLLRKFYTKAQKTQLQQFVPTEYNSIYMDSEDFLWGTISSLNSDDILSTIQSHDKSGTVAPIRKLNSMGNDILKRNGSYAPIGRLVFR